MGTSLGRTVTKPLKPVRASSLSSELPRTTPLSSKSEETRTTMIVSPGKVRTSKPVGEMPASEKRLRTKSTGSIDELTRSSLFFEDKVERFSVDYSHPIGWRGQ